MPDIAPVDSHESASMAQPPSTAEVDGWEVESSSAVQPSSEELVSRLSEDPVPVPEASEEAPEPVSEDHDDSLDDEPAPKVETMERGADGKFTKKKKLTAAERKAVLQAEFNALTRQREDAKRAFEAEEAERAARRASREAAPAEPAATPAATATDSQVDDGAPDWDTYEAEGKSFPEYQRDFAKWLRGSITAEVTSEARRAADAKIAEERRLMAEEAAMRAYDERLDAVRAERPDFVEVVNENLADVPQTPFMRSVVLNHPVGPKVLLHLADHPAEAKVLATLPMSRPMMDAVKESADPRNLLSYFANHPEDHGRIAAMDLPRQLLALGRLSAELSPSGAKTGSPAATHPVTNARPPIRPVGATRSAGVSHGDDDDTPFGPEYVRRENERRAAARR